MDDNNYNKDLELDESQTSAEPSLEGDTAELEGQSPEQLEPEYREPEYREPEYREQVPSFYDMHDSRPNEPQPVEYPLPNQYRPMLNVNPSAIEERGTALPYEPQPDDRSRSKKSFIVALCVLCAVVGGIVGGISSGMFLYKLKDKDSSAFMASTSVLAEAPSNTAPADYHTLAPILDVFPTAAPTEAETTSESTTQTTTSSVIQAEKMSARDVYANNINSVVGITVTVKYMSSFFGQSYDAVVTGSGFIISEDGYILTNHHVIEGANSVMVSLHDGRECPAEIIGYEAENDIALIKISAGSLQSVKLGDSSTLEIGDEIIVIGTPLGELTNTLTNGVVSALDRKISADNGVNTINTFQTNAAINNGNSGGPVFDMHGNVVGVVFAKYSSANIEGLSFCIPINDVVDYVNDFVEYGYVRNKPLLGVSVQTITPAMAKRYSLVIGAYVVDFDSNSPAGLAGITQGSVICALNSTEITSADKLKSELANYKNGDSILLKIFKNGAYSELEVVLGERVPSSARTDYSNVIDL